MRVCNGDKRRKSPSFTADFRELRDEKEVERGMRSHRGAYLMYDYMARRKKIKESGKKGKG